VPDLDDLIIEIDRFAERLEDAAGEAVNHGAFVFKGHLQKGIRRVLGSDMEFTEGGGVPVNVRYRTSGTGDVHTARIYPLGPAHWLRRIQPHDIAPRRGKALKFDDGGIRRTTVRHPGISRDRSTWDDDKQRAAPEAAEAMAGWFRRAVGEG